jgi:hypothetical protein
MTEKREAFGNRHLTDGKDVFEFNAWDNVEWDQELISEAEKKIQMNSSVLLSSEKAGIWKSLNYKPI